MTYVSILVDTPEAEGDLRQCFRIVSLQVRTKGSTETMIETLAELKTSQDAAQIVLRNGNLHIVLKSLTLRTPSF